MAQASQSLMAVELGLIALPLTAHCLLLTDLFAARTRDRRIAGPTPIPGEDPPPTCYPNELCAHRFSCCLSLRFVWPLCQGKRSLKQAHRCLLMIRTHPETVIGKLTSLGRFHKIEAAVFLELRC